MPKPAGLESAFNKALTLVQRLIAAGMKTSDSLGHDRLGAAATLNFVPAPLEPYYGSRNPTGIFVFLRMRPFHSTRPAMRMNDMEVQMKHGYE